AAAHRDPLQRIQLRRGVRGRLAPDTARGADARGQDAGRACRLPQALAPVYRRLSTLVRSLWPDPARTGLAWWLVAIHVTLVLLVGGGICWSASRMLRDLADEQGKARVQLAATTAREDLRRIGEDARAAAQALAERPTLQRLLAEGRQEALPPF